VRLSSLWVTTRYAIGGCYHAWLLGHLIYKYPLRNRTLLEICFVIRPIPWKRCNKTAEGSHYFLDIWPLQPHAPFNREMWRWRTMGSWCTWGLLGQTSRDQMRCDRLYWRIRPMMMIMHGQVPKIMDNHSNFRLVKQKRLILLFLVFGRAMVLIN
jgi:hypothetical protein